MTRVDYYILGTEGQNARLDFACRLAEKAFRQGCRVYLHTETADDARTLDDRLWGFKPESFVPHNLISESLTPPPPVQIGFGDDPAHHSDVLINASNSLPGFFSRFKRVAEIVTKDEPVKKRSREHFRFYKDRGYPMHTHNIK